jgi:hypothetical protein
LAATEAYALAAEPASHDTCAISEPGFTPHPHLASRHIVSCSLLAGGLSHSVEEDK